MGSVAGLKGGTPHLLYPTSKGAIVNMTRAMAAHHAGDGIRVNCVCPGMLYTPMMYAGGMSEEARAARRQRSLLGTEVDAGTTAAVGIGMVKAASVNG
ncbi:2-(S)-hydroxypropyl-CoM dehydrogenase [Colletotrichum fructicola Nara gc5]|uniref:2-(S)-hydroxypropyl-CoM dehydrogenase n=1 Tax=Colletotrichum fructicola (strain Nara gc5) TaxID=1213859 RepID=A0A7J6J6P5_COLFN|nr:2-(S)-hydroxypropyl-CoM dehydrogenase [Colletotrichum fructicola Nara gc5]